MPSTEFLLFPEHGSGSMQLAYKEHVLSFSAGHMTWSHGVQKLVLASNCSRNSLQNNYYTAPFLMPKVLLNLLRGSI